MRLSPGWLLTSLSHDAALWTHGNANSTYTCTATLSLTNAPLSLVSDAFASLAPWQITRLATPRLRATMSIQVHLNCRSSRRRQRPQEQCPARPRSLLGRLLRPFPSETSDDAVEFRGQR